MEQQNTQVTSTKKIPTKLVAVMAIIAVVLLTFIIGGLVILANNNRNNNNSNGDNNGTITPTPTNLAQCDYNGIKYDSGQSFDKGDSCNTCSCENGVVSCEDKECTEEYETILKKPGLDESDLYEYKISISIPFKTNVEIVKEYDLEIQNEDFQLYISPNAESVGSPLFEKLQPTLIINPYSDGMVRLNMNNELRQNLGNYYPDLNKYTQNYFYSTFYTENQPCHEEYESVTGKEVIGCYELYSAISFINQSNSNIVSNFLILCSINNNALLTETCDFIVKSLNLEFIRDLTN